MPSTSQPTASVAKARSVPTTKPIPKKPTLDEHIKMIIGPKVDIYVGESIKHYRLPKLLLYYYSPYFDRCFNGGFKEGTEQKLELPDDKIEDFEVIIEYMLRSTIPRVESSSYDFTNQYMKLR
ncbi:hypothetical protein VTL71DRAFT_8124 [Oculimacula yallundae]|uniref:BTB domain-containing protein n=1 Tax=Oculimacula yallundae TaxID=86028 RepID=A0ABR4CXY0_9HELO